MPRSHRCRGNGPTCICIHGRKAVKGARSFEPSCCRASFSNKAKFFFYFNKAKFTEHQTNYGVLNSPSFPPPFSRFFSTGLSNAQHDFSRHVGRIRVAEPASPASTHVDRTGTVIVISEIKGVVKIERGANERRPSLYLLLCTYMQRCACMSQCPWRHY